MKIILFLFNKLGINYLLETSSILMDILKFDLRLDITYLWKSSMQWIWLVASTVNGIPSRLLPHTTQVKQAGWYGFPVARSNCKHVKFIAHVVLFNLWNDRYHNWNDYLNTVCIASYRWMTTWHVKSISCVNILFVARCLNI